MPPLKTEERRRFVESALAMGVPGERIKRDLARIEGQQPGEPLDAPADLAPNPNPMNPMEEATRGYQMERDKADQRMLGQGAALGIIGGLGGTLGRAGLSAARASEMPGVAAVASRVPMPVVAAAGEAATTYTGSRATGSTPREARINALAAGGAGLAVEGTMNMVGRAGMAGAGISRTAANEALARPPRMARRLMYGAPDNMAELGVGREVLGKISESVRDISPGRLAKVGVMKEAEAAGVHIKLDDMMDAIVGSIDTKAISPGAKLANRRFTALWDDIASKYGTDVTPAQADEILQKVRNSVANLYDKPNSTEVVAGSKNIAEALKTSFYRQVEEALPGSDIAGKAKASRAYLDSVETLDSFVSDKTPEAFVKSLFKGDDVSQSALAALRDFEKQTGTGGALERQIHELSMKREFTNTDRVALGRIFYIFERVLSRPIGKLSALLARPAGSAAAGGGAAISSAVQGGKPAPQKRIGGEREDE